MILNNIKNKFLYDFGFMDTDDIKIIKKIIEKGVDLKPRINGSWYGGLFEIEYGRVRKLSISDLNIYRNIRYLDNEVFDLISELYFLEVLYITVGEISTLPESLSKLTRLQELVINFQPFKEFPLVITKLKNLKTLQIIYSQIEEIPYEIYKLQYLDSLVLPSNKIKSIPSSIGKLTNLEYIILYNNQIEEIAPELFNLTNLLKIDLSNNKISNIPKDIGKLINLKGISFANKAWYEEYKKRGLRDIDYNINTISSIPLEMKRLNNLETILLDNNPIIKSVDKSKYDKISTKDKINFLIKYQENFVEESKGETTNMAGTTYNIYGQVGAVGDNAISYGTINKQILNNESNYEKLAEELRKIMKSLDSCNDKTLQQEIENAIDAADKKDKDRLSIAIKAVGKKVLDISEKIGTELATAYIKSEIGL